jgi:hypothetical protein
VTSPLSLLLPPVVDSEEDKKTSKSFRDSLTSCLRYVNDLEGKKIQASALVSKDARALRPKLSSKWSQRAPQTWERQSRALPCGFCFSRQLASELWTEALQPLQMRMGWAVVPSPLCLPPPYLPLERLQASTLFLILSLTPSLSHFLPGPRSKYRQASFPPLQKPHQQFSAPEMRGL